jgi:hypothetical protein
VNEALFEYGARLPERVLATGIGDAGRASAIKLVGNPAGPYVGGQVMMRPLDHSREWTADKTARVHVARVLVEHAEHALDLAADQWGGRIAEAASTQLADARGLTDDLARIRTIMHHLDVQAHAIGLLPISRVD